MIHQSSNSKIADPFLLKVLKQHRGQSEFTDILRSIQDEQNEIVDFDIKKNMIVQGCAGSGKTMILFHRLANILYNINAGLVKIAPGRIAVIIPNDNFRNYIKDLTWSLGIDGIRTYAMDEYLLSKVEETMKRIFTEETDDCIKENPKKREVDDFDDFMSNVRKNVIGDSSESAKITFDDGVARSLVSFICEYKNVHKRMVDERREERDKRFERKRPGVDSEYNRWRTKSLEAIRKHRGDAMKQLEKEFLDGKLSREYMIGFLNVFYANYNLVKYSPNSDDLVMIDEGQDYGFLEYELLKTISPFGFFNIYGDIDQKIYERGISEWDNIQKLFDAQYFELNVDYRNSNQVVEFVNETFNKEIVSVGFSAKDVEKIPLSKLPVYLEYEDRILKHNIAIITEKPEIYKGISGPIKIFTVKEIKGLEFDTIFISPEISHENYNCQYVSYTRALSHLYILSEA